MSALTPYVAGALANPSLAIRQAAFAAELGKELAMYGGRAALSSFKGRKRARGNPAPRQKFKAAKKRMENVGEDVGKGTAKRHDTIIDDTLTTRELRSDPLLNIPFPSTVGALNQRLRDIVHFVGVKICMSVLLNTGVNTPQGQHVYMNVAVISAKEQNLSTPDSVPPENFFRGNGIERGTDFSTNLTALEFRCLPINSDKYTIHYHKRHTLAPFSSNEGRNQMTTEFYIPVNRQIRYDRGSENPDGANMFLVYWADFQDKAGLTPIVTGNLNQQVRIVRYFKEPRNG